MTTGHARGSDFLACGKLAKFGDVVDLLGKDGARSQ